MQKQEKRSADDSDNAQNQTKKFKKNFEKPIRKGKTFNNNSQQTPTEKPNWNDLKKQKKELKLKRKEQRNKDLFSIIVEAKKLAETLRQKKIDGGKDERFKLVKRLHSLLGGHDFYAKLVLGHDTARIVQYLLKFAPEDIRNAIAKELIPLTVEMLQSKYGRYCLKNMLKYGNNETRSASIRAMYGNAVKLTSHSVSSSVFEYIYTTWTSQKQKHHFIQEFFGDIYKKIKDEKVKHLRDVYADSPNMKAAALASTKANLSRIMTKLCLDSGLVQSVLYQYLTECSIEDRTEFISQLSPHVVVLSNSKDGVRVVMKCIWQGTNKDKKIIIKAIKEHVIDLSKHEHGHGTVITLLDATDDTVLINKMILSKILSQVQELIVDEWGRKILLWLVAPANSTHFHPIFIKELDEGRYMSTSKKPSEARRLEILNYTIAELLKLVTEDPNFWLSKATISIVTVAILKARYNKEALEAIAKIITDKNWKVDGEMGIENAGLHMALKKLIQHTKSVTDPDQNGFGQIIVTYLTNETLKTWLDLNRGCFLLVSIFENGPDETQESLKKMLSSHSKYLSKQSTSGAKILSKKLD